MFCSMAGADRRADTIAVPVPRQGTQAPYQLRNSAAPNPPHVLPNYQVAQRNSISPLAIAGVAMSLVPRHEASKRLFFERQG
jgi:hypothetical protein